MSNQVIAEHHAAHPVDEFYAKVESAPHLHKEFSSTKLDTGRRKSWIIRNYYNNILFLQSLSNDCKIRIIL